MFSALLTFILLCLRMAIDEFLIKKNAWSTTYIKYIISFLIQGVTVIVVAVPEGLPLAVTLALAYAVRQMTSDNNLVRHLDACETMGNATTICSDKTGTLTTNRMTVVYGYFGNRLVKKIDSSLDIPQSLKSLINESIAINTNYTTILEVDC
jgi:Ca2+ transporting ATPase